MPVDVGQSATAALALESQAFVIDTHQGQNCGVEVVNVNAILGNVVAELVGRSIGHAALILQAR